jgi:hypothetical protein
VLGECSWSHTDGALAIFLVFERAERDVADRSDTV